MASSVIVCTIKVKKKKRKKKEQRKEWDEKTMFRSYARARVCMCVCVCVGREPRIGTIGTTHCVFQHLKTGKPLVAFTWSFVFCVYPIVSFSDLIFFFFHDTDRSGDKSSAIRWRRWGLVEGVVVVRVRSLSRKILVIARFIHDDGTAYVSWRSIATSLHELCSQRIRYDEPKR